MATALLCGSVAYDNIMRFDGRFQDHLLADQLHQLNVAFLVPHIDKQFGGCAGNIAYNLHLMNEQPILAATVGHDAHPYLARCQSWGLSTDYLQQVPNTWTAQAFITTDANNNQITAFHPGAMQYSHLNPVANIVEKRPDIMLVVVSPDGRDGMLQHIQHAHDSQIAVMFDPGQAMPLFSGEELLQMVKQSNYLIMNDYEAQLMMDKTQCTREELAQQVDVLIITQGALGSEVWSRTTPESSEMTCQPIHIPSVKPIQIVDPTGCGDAYRAGFIYGLLRGWSAIHAAQLGSVMGALKIEAAGGQNHQPALATIQAQFTTHFNHNPWLASLQDELRHTL